MKIKLMPSKIYLMILATANIITLLIIWQITSIYSASILSFITIAYGIFIIQKTLNNFPIIDISQQNTDNSHIIFSISFLTIIDYHNQQIAIWSDSCNDYSFSKINKQLYA